MVRMGRSPLGEYAEGSKPTGTDKASKVLLGYALQLVVFNKKHFARRGEYTKLRLGFPIYLPRI